jgi:hypothetical protein
MDEPNLICKTNCGSCLRDGIRFLFKPFLIAFFCLANLFGEVIDTVIYKDRLVLDLHSIEGTHLNDSIPHVQLEMLNHNEWWINWSEMDAHFESQKYFFTTRDKLEVHKFHLKSDSIDLDNIIYPIASIKRIELYKRERYTRGAKAFDTALRTVWLAPAAYLIEAIIWPFSGEYNWGRPLVISGAVILSSQAIGQAFYKAYVRSYETIITVN